MGRLKVLNSYKKQRHSSFLTCAKVLRFARDFSYIPVQNATLAGFNTLPLTKLPVNESTAMPFAKALSINGL